MHGLPSSWESSAATIRSSDGISATTWSPCSRTIAICRGGGPPTIEILDAVTLVPLTALEPVGTWSRSNRLIFSPNGHLLTLSGSWGKVITWDLQTGVVVSFISTEPGIAFIHPSPVTYSACGTMFGVLFENSPAYTLCTYNALSGTCIYTYPVKGPIQDNIWTCGECLQFATMEAGSVIIWEVGFVSTHPPTQVRIYSIPDSFCSPNEFLFHPTLPRLALRKEKRICVWSTQDSKFLLDSVDLDYQNMLFSPDGHFFAYINKTSVGDHREVLLWKESYTGYVLHKRLATNFSAYHPLISPDGGSIIAAGYDAIQLWHTTDSSTLLPTSSQNPNHFIVEFSPDQVFAAIVRLEDEIVTVLDLKSGVPILIINTDMGVYGLGITGSSIVVVGDRKIITWNIPTRDHIPNLRLDITNSIHTVTFNQRQFNNDERMLAALVSPDLHYVVIKDRCLAGDGQGSEDGQSSEDSYALYLYDILTGQHLSSVPVKIFGTLWFTLDGSEVWCWDFDKVDRWKITEGSGSNTTKLEYLGSTEDQPDRWPWQSSRDYKVVHDQWIFSPSGKLLFWLPPHLTAYQPTFFLGELQSSRAYQWHLRHWTWSGQFLALLHHELSEAVILELE